MRHARRRTGNVSMHCAQPKAERAKAWVKANVPGGALHLICCDFGSEYAKQGHGDDWLTRALKVFFSIKRQIIGTGIGLAIQLTR